MLFGQQKRKRIVPNLKKQKRVRNTIEIDIEELPETTKLFIGDTIKRANANNCRVKLLERPVVYIFPQAKKFPISGYFDEDSLVVACGAQLYGKGKNWVSIMAHESCHLDQSIDDKAIWDQGDSVGPFDEWCTGQIDLTPRDLLMHMKNVQALEHDCEIRTIEKMQKYDLPINIKTYARQANTYIWFYTAVAMKRKWFREGHQPYKDPRIFKKMPPYMLPLQEYEKMPSKLLKLFEDNM